MNQIVFLIENLATGFYLFGALIILVNLRGWMLSRRDLGLAEFALERDLARRKQARSITSSLLAIEFVLAVFATSRVVAPTVRADLVGGPAGPGGPEVVVFQTLAPNQATLVNAQGTPIDRSQLDAPFQTLTAKPPGDSVGVIATATLAPTPPGTIIPGAPAPVGCDAQSGATLEIPANGQVLYEAMTVRGVATVQNFARYKFEISGPSTGGNFAPYGGDKTQPVRDVGVLGQISLLPFDTGEYQFKLAVFDANDQLRASCTVTIYLRRHPPTPTPITPTPTPIR